MKLLIVEDNVEILESLTHSLKYQGFIVDTALDGIIGFDKAKANNYDLIILDIELPRKSGDVICRELRSAGKQMPIIILSVKSEIETRAELLLIGADDYVIKPFSFLELLARIRACLRRPLKMIEEVFRIGTLEININTRMVMADTEKINLTPKEFFVLEYLIRHRGMVVSRAELLEYIWGEDINVFSNTIETHMSSIRRKLKEKSTTEVIHTIRYGGYKIF
jgi:two-component system copper resistance phosphate regulon response regulator CusR